MGSDFGSIGQEGKLQWTHAPGSWGVVGAGVVVGETEGTGGDWYVDPADDTLVVKADAKKDIWRRTYYE